MMQYLKSCKVKCCLEKYTDKRKHFITNELYMDIFIYLYEDSTWRFARDFIQQPQQHLLQTAPLRDVVCHTSIIISGVSNVLENNFKYICRTYHKLQSHTVT